MRPIRPFLPLALLTVAAVLLLCALAPPARAAPPRGRDAAFEQKIATELQAFSPDAVPIFHQATAASDAGDAASAADLFSKVLQLAPGFSHAERRKCGALAQLERRDEALALCRSALAREASPANEAALAVVLLATKGEPSDADAVEAGRLAARAVEAQPDDPYYWGVALRASVASRDLPGAERASARLEELAPDDPMTGYYAAALAAERGDLDRASALLVRARTNGLPDAAAASLARALDDAHAGPWWMRGGRWLGRALAGWVALLALLLGAGYALSRATLRAVAARPTEAHVRPSERRLRRAYRAVLWCACAFYYASLPLLAVVVLLVTAGGIGGILAAGFIAPKLFIILAFVAFASLGAIARSVFVRVTPEDPGLPLDLGANPGMRAALDEVAARIRTRPVDRVFVTPFTEVAVFDRASLGTQLRGGSDRCLILGAGVLDGMRLRAFKSILAHEYGHFHNEDTAGGGFALAVRRSLFAMTMQLVARRVASTLNPAWWFVRGFWRAFLGISQGASRLQEVLADRWAAFAYGSRAFDEGLRHVIERSVRFDAHLGATVDEVVKTRSALPNLYAFAPAAPPPLENVEKAIADALGKKPTPFDSHPCPEDRLRWVQELAFPGAGTDADDAEAWSLFADRRAIEAQMTARIRELLRARRGVTVPAS